MLTNDSMAKHRQTVYDSLGKIKIGSLIKHRRSSMGLKPLLCVSEKEPLAKVLEIMREANILAVPVYAVPDDEPSGKIYTGIVSVYDVLAHTVFQKMFQGMEETSADDGRVEFQKYMDNVMDQSHYFSTPVGELVGETNESTRCETLHSSDPLTHFLQMVSSGLHRLLVIDDDALAASAQDDDGFGPTAPPSGSSLCLLTQTDLLRFLKEVGSAHGIPAESLEALFGTTLSAVNELAASRAGPDALDPNQLVSQRLGKHVITAPSKISAIAAFRMLYLHRVSAVAIVNEDGLLVNNLSASDLRGLTMANIETMLLPVFEYLEAEKRVKDQLHADQLRVLPGDATLDQACTMVSNVKDRC